MTDSERSMVLVDELAPADWSSVRAIYAAGIATGHATFASTPPTWQEFDAGRLPEHRFVARDPGGDVVGWVSVSATSTRAVYVGVVEVSIYVDPAAAGRGVGGRLLDRLVASTETAGIWTLQAGIFPENQASLRLHERAGFRVVGRRERLGYMTYGPLAGRWRDVILLERRSTRIG